MNNSFWPKRFSLGFFLFITPVACGVGFWDLLFGNNHFSSAHAAPLEGIMPEYEMTSYVRQMCRAFGYQLSYSEVAKLENMIVNSIKSDRLAYQSQYPHGYIRKKVDEYVSSGLIQYVEEYSYTYAYNRLNNNARARAISESMRGNALALISQSGTIEPAKIAQFIGASLKKAVDYELANNSEYYAPAPAYNPPYNPAYQPQTSSYTTYPSKDCCVCMETYSSSVKRIFLKPCGHDICLQCAYAWFLDRGNRTCPQCRSTVSLPDLEASLAQ